MARTPDRRPGVLKEEEVLFDDRTADGDPTDERAIRYVSGSFRAKDSAGVFDLRQGAASDTKEVKVSVNDTTPAFLEDKLQAGTNITLTTLNEGGNEKVEIAASGSVDDKRVKVSTDDTTPGFLEEKIVPGGDISIAVLNPGGDEDLQITANVGTIFSSDAINATIQLTTSLTSAQNAFAGESPDFLVPASDGDYLCFFATDIRTTNNNTEAEIALALNTPASTIVGTEHRYTNTQRGFSSSAFRVNGLVTTDKIYANFRKVSGNGSVEIYNRNLFMFRVA
jgi:hypothetical protein